MTVVAQTIGPVLGRYSWTVFADTDLSAAAEAIVDVVATGDTDLTTASDGWTRIAQVKLLQGNFRSSTVAATLATFVREAPGTAETLVVDSAIAACFSAILKMQA